MGLFHQHNFIKDGIDLFCNCGQIKKLSCLHKWSEQSMQGILTAAGKKQVLQIVKCDNCGEFKSINQTTGGIE